MIIQGDIDWLHGLNLVRKQPAAVTIHLMDGDREVGVKVVKREDDWHWMFRVPETSCSKKPYVVTVDGMAEYQTYIDEYTIINVHHSVVMEEDGRLSGRFVSKQKEYNMPSIPPLAVFSGGVDKFWFFPKNKNIRQASD